MKLFQRVKRIASELAGSETKLAGAIGMQQRTLNGYLRLQREDNLWVILPKILEVYPQVHRDWLYFGEGEMLRREGAGLRTVVHPLRVVAYAQEAATQDAGMAALDRENAVLRELVSSQKETIASLRELLAGKDKIIAQCESRVLGFSPSANSEMPAPTAPSPPFAGQSATQHSTKI